ncbi:MAG TPA: YkgJ family cysteine cluster protein [Methanothrix sp.]|nr:YkgJ family cysteine cluster protein [Methanothrix sp.]HPT20027.1 YkgJ family cysteine cluster protein [Methanothrix sp.]
MTSEGEQISQVRRLCHMLCNASCVQAKRRGDHEALIEQHLPRRPHWSVARREEQVQRIDRGEAEPFDISLPLPAKDGQEGSDTGVALFWERFRCQECGRCCYTPGAGLFLEKEDYERIAERIGKKRLNALCRRDKAQSAWIVKQPCPFYDRERKGCTIYDIRPQTCTKYPLHPPLPELPYNLAVDAFCPAAREFVKETLGWWIICESNWARLLARMGDGKA